MSLSLNVYVTVHFNSVHLQDVCETERKSQALKPKATGLECQFSHLLTIIITFWASVSLLVKLHNTYFKWLFSRLNGRL